MLNVINEYYGSFSNYTIPIFIQDYLAELTNEFKTKLDR